MSSIGGILSTARTAIHAHQVAVSVASQNIANAQTEGYSRQRVELTAGFPQQTPIGSLGTGVSIVDVSRARDALVDTTYRREAGKAASFGARRDILTEVEAIFAEPSENGIGATLDAFWNAWSDLSNAPTSGPARAMVRQRGEQVSSVFQRVAGQLSEIEQATKLRLTASVDEINHLARQVADVNVNIVAAESGGKSAPDLRDSRDRLIDRMAKLGETRVVESANGGVAVLVDGETLVDGSTVRTIDTPRYNSAGKLVVEVQGSPVRFGREGSVVGELLSILNVDINGGGENGSPLGVMTRLNAMAADLVRAVNTEHAKGWSAAGEALGNSAWPPAPPPHGSRVDFFDPALTDARSIALSSAVRADAAVIATGYTRDATSDNTLALKLAGFRSAGDTANGGTQSFSDFHRDTVSGLALRVNSAENSATVYETLTAQAENRRQSVSGVSTDEELIKLMQHQQAYTAASKLLKVVDEMMQTLMNF